MATTMSVQDPPTARPDSLLESLYREHGPAVLTFFLAYTGGDRHWAEDVLQETMLRAWRHATELDVDQRSLRPWLFTVARRIAIDGIRRRRARPTDVDLTLLDAAVPAADDTLRAVIVAAAVNELPRPHCAVITELYLCGRSTRDTATRLDIPLGTVKFRAHYALRRLRLTLVDLHSTDAA